MTFTFPSSAFRALLHAVITAAALLLSRLNKEASDQKTVQKERIN
jgi:hypothetical protein